MRIRAFHFWIPLFLTMLVAKTFATPDLVGFDGRLHGFPQYCFNVQQSSIAAGQQVNVDFFIANFGNTASGAFKVRLYLSKDSTINPGTDYLFSSDSPDYDIPSLAPSSFNGGTVAVTIPPQDTINSLGGAGTFWIGIVADSQNQVAESNESNNSNQADGTDRASLTVTIPPSDLTGFDGRPSNSDAYFDILESQLRWGDSFHIHFATANLSGGNAGNFKTMVYLSTDSSIGDADDYLIAVYERTNGLPGFNYYSLDDLLPLPVVNPFTNSQTNFYVGMVVDANNNVTESDENNNLNLGLGIDLDGVTIVKPLPAIQITDSVPAGDDHAVDFGSVANDGPGHTSGTQTVTIINNGKASLTIANLMLSGNQAFSIKHILSSTESFISASSLPQVIAPNANESWVITLLFDPTTNGAASGTLTMTSDDPTTPSLAISLIGNGVPVPKIALTTPQAAETDFGSVVQDGVGGFQSTHTISLKNVGTGPLTVNQNGITLLTGNHYTVVSVTSSTQGVLNLATGSLTMAAGGTETWDVVLKFDPTAAGLLMDGLRVASNDPDEAIFPVSLTGRGLQSMHLVVTDSSGVTNDHAVAFPDVHADGPGKQNATATLSLQNSGEAPLTVLSNGLTLATGIHFHVESITSSTAGAINLATGAKQIAGTNSETWTVVVAFDPGIAGVLSDTLTIRSDDPAASAVVVSLTGQGISRPALMVSDSVLPANDLAVPFGSVLNDGLGGRDARQTVTLTDIGAQSLIVAQNGLSLFGGSEFSIVSVISSTRGAVNVFSANPIDRTIASAQNETWTVTLAFDPTANGPSTGTLDISSNDTDQPTVHVSLSATGATPAITLTTPALPLNVSAGSVFDFTWQYAYPGTNAILALYLDTDANPATALIPIATGISADTAGSSYSWRVDHALVGTNYHVYATITDGSVTGGSYAAGTLTTDPVGAFHLQSSSQVTSPDYAYQYLYNGQVYQGVTHLATGNNIVTVSNSLPGGGTATFQFAVELASSLIHTESVQRDALNRVVQIRNGNGIVTTLTYDQMGRLVQRASSNGAVVNYTYGVLDRRTSMTDYTGTTFYEWDDLDRLIAVIASKNAFKGDGDDLALRYEYDLADRRAAIIYPGGERIQYTFDDAGRMTTVNNVTRGLLFTYAYNPANGLLTQLSRPNAINTLYSYDGMARVTAIRHQRANGNLVAEFFYTLDVAGKATEMRETKEDGSIRREGYTYDRFDRLIQIVYAEDGIIDANDKTVSYTYDGSGNRLTMTAKVNNTVTEVRNYHYGNGNRLVNVADGTGATIAAYYYDAVGNVIEKVTPQRPRFTAMTSGGCSRASLMVRIW